MYSQYLTFILGVFHNENMRILSVFVCLLFWLVGCGDEEVAPPSFPIMKNPLNQLDVLQSALNEATALSDLTVTTEGNLQIYRTQNGSLYNGWVQNSHISGKLGFLFHCEKGRQDGLHTAWYENGKKMVERTWKDGVREGPFKTWTAAGVLESRGYNKENQRSGLFEEFYASGQKKSEVTYTVGKIEMFTRWKPDGTKCPYTSIQGGTGVVVHYGVDGTIDSNESFYQGEIDYGRAHELNEVLVIESNNNNVLKENNSSSASTLENE